MEEQQQQTWKNTLSACIQYVAGFLRARRSNAQVLFPIRVIDVRATLGSSHGGIHFVAPTGWNFHVISHTWTEEIRSFSKQIGERILKEWRWGEILRKGFYDRCLERADLTGEPAYKDLVEFMEVLAEDGVTHIWFDTLCINQTDSKEKGKEIGHMGAYYSRSKGCYALVHGIGQGYDLWSEDNPDILPRWFHRVWTIQEFALPTSLMFVTKLPKKVHKIANTLMRKANSSAGFCRCCIFKDVLEVTRDARSPKELLQSSGIDDNGPTLDDSIDFSGEQSVLVCSECRTSSLVKRGQRTISGGSIYMVEREAYLYLLFLDSFLMMERTTSVRIAEVMKSLERPWDPWMVVAEVATRQCTYDEDRILGTLGLLGVGGEMQIRTGQSLEEQLVHVAKFCHPDLLLKICTVDPWGGLTPGMSWVPNFRVPDVYRGVIGCGIHVRNVYRNFGHYVYWRCCAHLEPGRDILPQPLDIAWLETSTMANIDDEAKITRLSEFRRQVEVVNVTHHGIMLKGIAVVGRVIPHERLGSKDQEAIKAMMTALSPPRSEQGSSAQMEEYEEFRLWRKVGGEIESPTNHTPTHCIKFQDVGIVLPLIVNLRWSEDPFPLDPCVKPFPQLVMAYVGRPQNPILVPLPNNQGALNALQSTWRRLEDTKIWIDMELWVVLLGTIGNEKYSVAMVCVGPKGNTKEDIVELHKVGILVLPIQIGGQLFGIDCQGLPKFYRVGGFGEDLSEFAIVRVATE